MVLKLLKSLAWLSGGAGLLVRIGDVFASDGMLSILTVFEDVGGRACGGKFRSLGGLEVREVLFSSSPVPWESSSDERSGEVLNS